MKNWVVVVAGFFLAVGLTHSESAKAEFPGMGVGVNIGIRAATPMMAAPMGPMMAPVGGFNHAYPGVGFPPPFYSPYPPRPYCGQSINPYMAGMGMGMGMMGMPGLGMGMGMAAYCPPYWRPHHRNFTVFRMGVGPFRFEVGSGNSYN